MRCFTAPQSAVSNSSRILTTAISSWQAPAQGVAVPGIRIGWVIASKKNIETMATTLALAWEESVIHPNTMLLSCSSPIVSGGPGKQLNNITTGKETLWSSIEEMGLGFTREMVGSTIGWSCQKDWIARVSTNASSNMVLRYYVPLIVTWTGLTPRTRNMRLLTVDFSGSHSARFFPRVLSPISSYLVEYWKNIEQK